MQEEHNTKRTHTKFGSIFFEGLTLLFIAFKMLEVTVVNEWSWIWVLSPLWIPIIILLSIQAIIITFSIKAIYGVFTALTISIGIMLIFIFI